MILSVNRSSGNSLKPLIVLTAAAGWIAAPAVADPAPLDDLSGPWQLLVDDHLVAAKSAVTRTYHPFSKYAGNPVLTYTEPWEDSICYIYGTVMPNESTTGYRMWYHTLRPEDTNNDGSNILYATSTDGIHWVKPILNIRSWHGSTANNMIYNRPGPSGITSVMHTPFDPDPARRYRFMNFDIGGYWGAYSSDGVHTVDLPTNPMITDGGDVGQFMWDAHTGQYRGYVKLNSDVNGLRRRSVGHAATTDISTWPPLQLILEPDTYDDRWVPAGTVQRTHFYGLSAFAYESMYIGLLWIFRATDVDGYYIGPVYAEIVSSRDGLSWKREEGTRPAMLPLGPAGSWDDGQLYTARAPIRIGNELVIYYGACDDVHGTATKKLNCSIGMATLRKDGFVSLGAGGATGTILTKPLTGAGGPLRVNCKVNGGWLKVEVRDQNGVVVPGYAEGDCVALNGDSIDQAVTWAAHAQLPVGLPSFSLRFLLQNAELYSFMAGESVEPVDVPTITQQPGSQNLPAGGTAVFSVEATGTAPLSYQWQKNGGNLANGGHYAGVTSATLTVSSIDTSDVGSYRCVVSNSYGSVTSDAANLVLAAVSFTGIGRLGGATSSSVSGITADGSVVCGSSGGQPVIWSAGEGLRGLGLPAGAGAASAAGVGLYQGNVVVAVDTSLGVNKAQRWQGGASGVGTFAALPRVGGTREWTVQELGTDGTSNLWIAGSTVNGGDGNGREAVRYQQSTGSTGVAPLPTSPSGAHDHSDFYTVSDTGVCGGRVQYPGAAPTGGARQAWYYTGSSSVMVNTLIGVPVSTREAVILAVSRDGQVFGGWSYRNGFNANDTPAIWDHSSTPTSIPFIEGGDGDNEGSVLALSGDGALAGGYSYHDPGGSEEAFLWHQQHGTRAMQAVLTNEYGLNLAGWTLQRVTAISADGGVIAGIGLHDGQAEGWVANFKAAQATVVFDLDGDGDVDLADFIAFEACLSGTDVPAASGCASRDFDQDGDVDLSDFGPMQRCFSGEDVPVESTCVN